MPVRWRAGVWCGQLIASRFNDLCDWLQRLPLHSATATAPAEVLFVWWQAEYSDFARFNHGRLRQAGTVTRICIDLRLIVARRSAKLRLTVSGDASQDQAAMQTALVNLRAAIASAVDDPYLLINREPASSHRIQSATLATPEQAIATVVDAALGHDLVGAYMAGPIAVALWSNLGHRHYFEGSSWSFDFSIYARSDADHDRRDKAVKATVAAQDWQPDQVRLAINRAALDCEILYRPVKVLTPGSYRALLAPAALAAMVDMLNWGGFSARSHLTGQSPLMQLREGKLAFNTKLSLAEDLLDAAAPAFQADGFVRANRTGLIDNGRFGQWLCSPRTGSEFNIGNNGSGPDEQPSALLMASGDLPFNQQLAALDQGIAISNLWYLNFSDRQHCRITGMTRFATFWVEDGVAVAPIAPMRFDDSLYQCLGAQLLALGDQTQWLPNLSSYEWREFGGQRVPSALIAALRFTL